jgi:hypothetical protein
MNRAFTIRVSARMSDQNDDEIDSIPELANVLAVYGII